MNPNTQWFLAIFTLITLTTACLEVPEVQTDTYFGQLNVPSEFTYTPTRKVDFTVATEEQLPSVPLRIYFEDPELDGELIERGITNASGEVDFSLQLPIHVDSLYLAVDYIGIPDLYNKRSYPAPFTLSPFSSSLFKLRIPI